MKPLSLIHEKPLVWGHRGGRSLAAENTLKALRMAHEAGADGWETDVQLTKDGELIILHDLNLLRSTNASCHPLFKDNAPQVPWRFTLGEIKELSADVFPRRFCGKPHEGRQWERCGHELDPEYSVPTLQEALSLSRELGMWVNIEIKDLSHDVPRSLAKDVVSKVLATVSALNMDEQVIISSFNHDYVRECKARAKHVLTGALTPHAFAGDPVEMLHAALADAWHPGFRGLNAQNVAAVREAGFAINPYTVNELNDMQQLTAWGVTGLVTDFPQRACAWLSD
ncbi:glycerophosphodiester phosphodiesterase [Desulfobaculum bizertense]|uniref:Glycerophosphoryl diester phosphodiesterase n=1 Tax=Desulfobaculum bizertense DSM 18034 TaxID=1121442 RepID=A0A1T4VPS9_9BACT|nr:glycerophosphodiester phosphodiesterase family protein [Desulfobaculum bizertense]SKA66966.1 glycerophosphoryl diester phosphodiesterase [Desulfobaculum bizertense DSM 18034]